MYRFCLIILIIIIGFCVPVYANYVSCNSLYIKTSKHGRFYVKGVPGGKCEYGNWSKGKTFVYEVGEEEDKLLYTYDWNEYAQKVYLLDNIGSLVRLGSWNFSVPEPNEHKLVIGFYLDGKKLKEYSTLDIANMSDYVKTNTQLSNSYYAPFEEIIGFQSTGYLKFSFDVKVQEGKILSFNVLTGELRTKVEKERDSLLQQVFSLKKSCYKKSSEKAKESEFKHFLTEEAFMECVKENDEYLPPIPEGYKLFLGIIFDEPKLEKIN